MANPKKALEELKKKYGVTTKTDSNSSKAQATKSASSEAKPAGKTVQASSNGSKTKASAAMDALRKKHQQNPKVWSQQAKEHEEVRKTQYGTYDGKTGQKIGNEHREYSEATRHALETAAAEMAEQEMRDATWKDLLWNAGKRGYYNSRLGEESWKEMQGAKNNAHKYEQILQDDDYQFDADKWWEKAISGASEQVGQWVRQYTDPEALAYGTTAAAAAGIAGQVGPQALIPEEAITMPGAFFAGMAAGGASNNMQIEGGHAYREMLEAGVSEPTARKFGMAIGAGNALLEMIQFDEIVDAYKILDKTGVDTSIKRRIIDEMKERGIDIAKETAQEVAQEGVTIGGTQIASKLDTGEYAYTGEEVLGRLGDTAMSSALTFGALNTPAAVHNTYRAVQNDRQMNKIGSNYQVAAEDLVNEGLSFDAGTEAHKVAQTLRAKLDAGEAVSNRELANLVAANDRAIHENGAGIHENGAGIHENDGAIQNNTPIVRNDTPTARNNTPTVAENETVEPVNQPLMDAAMKAVGAKDAQNTPYNVLAKPTIDTALPTATDRGARALGNNLPSVEKKAVKSYSQPKYGTHGMQAFDGLVRSTGRTPAEVRSSFENAYQAGLENLPRASVNLLNGVQRVAYQAGRQDYIATLDESKRKGVAVWDKKGGVIANDLSNKLDTDTYTTLHKIGTATGAQILMDESLRGSDANGFYADGVIHISPDAVDPVMVVMKHELTHHLQVAAPKAYAKFRNYAMQKMRANTPKGVISQAEAKQNRYYELSQGREDLTTEEAMDEVAAEMTEWLLSDEKNLREFIDDVSSSTEKRMWAQPIFDAIHDFIEKIKSAFSKKRSMTDADKVAMYKYGVTFDQLVKAEELWKEAVTKAARNTAKAQRAQKAKAIGEIKEGLGKGATVQKNSDGDMLIAKSEDGSKIMYSWKTFDNGGREKLRQALRQNGHTTKEINDTIALIEDAADYLKILAAGYAKSHNYTALHDHLIADITTNIKTGKQAMSALVNNGDYPVNIDLALICKKRVAYMNLMTRLIEDGLLDKVDYKGEAIADVNEILRANNFETACLGCFVESRRLQFQAWAETICSEWNDEVRKRRKNPKAFGFSKGYATLTDAEMDALQEELQNAGKKNKQGNLNLGQGSVKDKIGRLLDRIPSLQQTLDTGDLLTPKGLAALRAYDSNLFSIVKSRYGAASPKIVQDFNPYASEIAMMTFKTVSDITSNAVKGAQNYIKQTKKETGGIKKMRGETEAAFKKRRAEFNAKAENEAMRRYLYDIGGARMQSFSDFMIENVFDYLQIYADLAANKFPLHGYTKEIICLRLFGMTGAKWNGSLIAHTERSMGKEYAGLMPASAAKDGSAILVHTDEGDFAIGFDDYARNKYTKGESFIQSIGMKDIIALQLDPRYSANVGSITIGVSDKHILAMLDHPLFSMVIPYHASGMLPGFAQRVGVDMYNDYTDYQNTTVRQMFDTEGNRVDSLTDSKGKVIKIDTSYAFNAEMQKTGDAKTAADNYIKWCGEKHPVYDGKKLVGYATFSPKFSDSPYGTDFSRHPNYYKLLEDFCSYDGVTGASALQGAVTMTFPSESNRLTAKQMDEYKQRLRDAGIFTEKDIAKYETLANKTFKELIADEVKGRAEYKVTQDAKWEKTVKEIEDKLKTDYARTETPSDVRYSLVDDKKTLDFLNGQKMVKVYRAMQEIDGKLYPPMAALVKGDKGKKQLVEETKIGAWYQADERPDLIKLDKSGRPKFELNKGNGSMVPAAYNPYFHTSASPLNDQFSSAYDRPNIVVVEGSIPQSELTSGYKAQYAKDSVGETAWHAGPVASKLKGAKARRVFLSRWFKAERVVPVDEVAQTIAQTLEGEDVSVPWNVVTPSLREALEAKGVPIDYKDVKMGSKVVSFESTQDGAKFSLKGTNKHGIEVYETSDEVKALSWDERKKRFLDLMINEYKGRTAKFVRNGHAYYATFEKKDVDKNIYGDKRSDAKGQKAKIKAGADGDVFTLVENARYDGSKPESGKNIAAHRGVKRWDYFVKKVQIDGTVFDLNINVRKKANDQYVYSLQLNEDKKTEAAPPMTPPIAGRASNRAQTASVTNTVTQQDNPVKFSLKDSDGNELTEEQAEYFKESKVRDSRGRLRLMYHGTNERFTVFDKTKLKDGLGFFFTEDKEEARDYGSPKEFYLNIKRPFDVFGDTPLEYFVGDAPKYVDGNFNAKAAVIGLKAAGYDGILSYSNGVTWYVAFDSEQIKSVDNKKPTSDPDIRFSLKDSAGRNLTEAQQTYFKDSVARDENGNLQVVYHGGTVESTFDTERGGDGSTQYGKGAYFTASEYYASEYSDMKGGKVKPYYLNIKKMFDTSDYNGGEIADSPEWDKLVSILKGKGVGDKQIKSIKSWGFDRLKDILARQAGDNAPVGYFGASQLANDVLREAGYDGIRASLYDSFQYVIFNPEQAKNVDNTAPTNNPDLRYSMKDSSELNKEIERILKEGKRKNRKAEDIQSDIRTVVGQTYREMGKAYGTITPGEKATREVNVPKKTGKKERVSQTVRTIMEAAATPDSMIPTLEQMTAQGEFSYNRLTNEKAMANAEASIRYKGFQTALADWSADVGAGKVSAANTAMGWALYNAAANEGDAKSAVDILTRMIGHQRNAAQAVQATRILKMMSPSAQLYSVQRSAEALTEDLRKKYGADAPGIELNEDLVKKLMEAKTEEAKNKALKELYKDIGSQMPATWLDKWNAWRYMAMLTNPTTHARNVLGNAFFAPVVIAKDMTATAIEGVVGFVARGKMGRSKAMPSGELLKAAWDDYKNAKDMIMGSGKYSDSAMKNEAIEEGRVIFDTKLLEGVRKGNSAAMEKEDSWFAKPHYAFALAQYCKANGVTADQLRRGKALGNARAYAVKEAQKATYRDSNEFSEFVSGLGRYHGDNKVAKAGSTVMEGILPFRKTPANILVRGLEYSPVGIGKALLQVMNKEATAADVIDSLSAGLVGTGLMALGAWLAAEGLIRGSGGDDDDEIAFEELQGHQAYSLELPDGTSATLDWLAPEVLPFFVGVNLYERMQESKEATTMSDMITAIANVTEPLLEMSCLQSLNDVFDSVGYASAEGLDALPSALVSAATSYLTQAFPTLLGKFERASEKERMTTYTEKNAFMTSDMQYTLGKISGKVPGWDYNQIPYIDAWGRTESNGSQTDRIVNNFANPAYMSEIQTSEMEVELQRLHDLGLEGKVLPGRAAKYFNVGTERKDLTAEEYVQYATEKGQRSYELLTDVMALPEYDRASDDLKVDMVEMAYEYANAMAKMSVSDYEPTGWVAKAIGAQENAGMSETEFILWKAALAMVDQPNKNGELGGTPTSAEKAAAIDEMGSLSDKQIAYLWDTKDGFEALDHGVDMKSYVDYVGAGGSVSVDKLAEVKKSGVEANTYFDFLDTLKEVDQPSKNGNYGTYTQEEAKAAIDAMPGLTRKQRAALYQSVNKTWKNNPYR